MLEDIANSINTLGDFCGKRDVTEKPIPYMHRVIDFELKEVLISPTK